MKKRKMIVVMAFLFISSVTLFTSCKRDSESPSNVNTLTNEQAIQVKDADIQDAIADKTEEDLDNKLEELQNNNYTISITKSGHSELTDTLVITIDHPDTTTFPKVVTFTYYNYKDSCANESILKNGEITITINCVDVKHPRMISRAFAFHNFSISTDSTTIMLRGTRLVNRQKDAMNLIGLQWARISVTDHVVAALSYSVFTTGFNDTLTFTRNVDKFRTAIAHYKNMNFIAGNAVYNLKHLYFKHIPSLDSLTFSGKVQGVNEKGESYIKNITSPLIIISYQGSLIISAGIISFNIIGTSVSYEVSFKEDTAHKHLTLVTVKDNNTGNSNSFDRKFGSVFKKWW
jgi:hypothetical protein